MDLGFPWNFTTLAVLLVPVILLLIRKWRKSKSESVKNLPPGPKHLPIIGDLHLLTALPFRSFRELSEKYGPLMHLKLGQVSTIVVSSPEIAKQMLKEHDPNFADKPRSVGIEIMWYDYTDIAFSPYGNYWRQMRKICVMELLSPKSVRSFASIRKDEISGLVGTLRRGSGGGEPINLTDKIFSLMSAITCRAAFGKVSTDNETLVKLLKEGIAMAGGFEISDLFPDSKIINALSKGRFKLLKMRRKLDEILDSIIDEHKVNLAKMERENGDQSSVIKRGNGENGNEDLVDVFLRIQENGGLEFPIGNNNIKAVLQDMFSAGTDTSSTAIDWTMTELMRNPRVMAKAQAEVREAFKETEPIDEGNTQHLKYLKMVIKESLRLHPPVPLLPRASREEMVLNGYTIPANVKVIVNNWAIQRDPKHWENPDSFEPERFEKNNSRDFLGGDFEFLPFGSGKRMCPGITFSMAGVELVLAQLLYSFNWKLPDGVNPGSLDLIENHGITGQRKENLYVVAQPC
ncbi:hypothetical protein ACP275_01G036800 [Erythranthe tilingii]